VRELFLNYNEVMGESYLPFFRKYRPQAFADVVGQDALVKALSNAIELSRFANAYLFCGPRGTGKTSSARIFAKSLNCVNGPTLTPCQKCPSCVDITNTSGLDVIEIDAATNRGIDDAKELISQVAYAPINGKYKIFIIDEVHMLSKEAFNALLKTFEEPPKNVIFILATTEPHKVIETIVSRCQRFDFRRITVDDITAKLREISEIEKIKITDEALLTIAKNVSGGLRDSLALLDQVAILGAKEEIGKELIDSLIGKITFEPLMELVDTILGGTLCEDPADSGAQTCRPAGKIEGALEKIEKIYAKGSEPRNFVENFIEFLRNLSVVTNAKNPQTVVKFTTLGSGEVENIVSKKYPQSAILGLLNKAIEFYKEIKATTNPYLWTELMLIEMCGLTLAPAAPMTVAPKQEIKIEPAKEVALPESPAPTPPPAPISNPEPPPAQGVSALAVQEPEVTPELPPIEQAPELPPVMQIPEPEPEPPLAIEPEALSPAQEVPPPEISTDDIWPKIVAAIQNPIAMPFFRDVPQSIEITENLITIGFVHPNAIAQAKRDSMFGALEIAIENVLAQKYNINFIQVQKIDKPKPASLPQTELPQAIVADIEEDICDICSENIPQVPEESDNDKVEEPARQPVPKIYSDKTKMMLEAFNGKIVD